MIKHSFTQRICVEDLLYAGAVLGVEQGSICGTWWDTQFCRGDSHPLNNYINNANNVCKLIVTSLRKCHKVHNAVRVGHKGFLHSVVHHGRLPRGGDIWTAT